MKKPSLSEALAKKPSGEPATLAEAAPAVKKTDGRMATTLRIEPDKLETLKVMAHRRQMRVNEMVLLAIDEFLTRNGAVKQ